MKPSEKLSHQDLIQLAEKLKAKWDNFGCEDCKAAIERELRAEIKENILSENEEIEPKRLNRLAEIAISHLDEHMD